MGRLLRERTEKRGKRSGRVVPVDKMEASVSQTRRSFDVLSPFVDFAARIDNSGPIPWLESCEDRSHSFMTLRKAFHLGKGQKHFPEGMPDVCVHRHELLSEQLELPESTRSSLCNGGKELQFVPLLSACRKKLRLRIEAEMKSRMDILDDRLFLLLSPTAEVNMDAHTRKRASVPMSARFSAMCHGCSTRDGRPVKLLPGFGSQGAAAFIYLSDAAEIVGVNMLSRCSDAEAQFFVHCSERHDLPSSVDWQLELADRWVRQVAPHRADGVAEAMAWLLPEELPECPFGAFAYRLCDGPEVFFPVTASE